LQGFQGGFGATGATGEAGVQGPQGLLGQDGIQGPTGVGVFGFRYSSGAAYITASGTGVTYSEAGGVGTITVPAGVELFHVRINGGTAQVPGTTFTVRITFSGTEYNTGDSDALFPKLMVWDRSTQGFGPSAGFPYTLRDAGDVGISVTVEALASGTMDVVVTAMNTFTFWTLVLDF
jgi:hypothetical protein